MRTVYFGTPEIAVPIVEAVSHAHEVTAVVCQPDRPQGRGKHPAAPPVKDWALSRGIEVHQPLRLNDGAFEDWLKRQAPEVGTVAAYGRLLKPAILAVPPKGWLNVHPSLLPRYRGPSPIQAAILAGDTETGVTIMRMSEEMDAGDIVLQKTLGISEDDTSATLSGKLATLGGALLLEAMALVAEGRAPAFPQDHAAATHCRLIEKEDGRIDWTHDAASLHHLVRACVPWPVAFTLLKGQPLRIFRVQPCEMPAGGDPGEIVEVGKDTFSVATGRGRLEILEVQAPGKRVMTAGEFLRGHKLERGQRFESQA